MNLYESTLKSNNQPKDEKSRYIYFHIVFSVLAWNIFCHHEEWAWDRSDLRTFYIHFGAEEFSRSTVYTAECDPA
ncbi:hypothetical protein BT63DRAFT_428449 [Microthyrium microscopicum]|uniref:Uncharacterized protein n=1 Tax=Microthyrium microscopicum TaxID=703497 RepID=A0A6A6U2K0_9PEZI|nr:hypothetical protein BT63DRAFT_428449 [Microthyrium microscopicum]